MSKYWIILAAAGLVSSCNFRLDKNIALQANGPVGFATVQTQILGPRCLSCHNGPSSPRGVDLSSYETIINGKWVVPGRPMESPIFESMAAGRMPKGMGRVPDAELELIRSWIEAGAPKQGSTTEPQTPPPETQAPSPTWAWISTRLLAVRCIGCHDGTHTNTELDLRTYESLMSFSNLGMAAVEPGDPKQSSLYLNLDEGTMPPRGPRLEAAEVEAVEDWIKNGAPKETP